MVEKTDKIAYHLIMNSNEPPKNPAERKAWIKYQLDLRGLNFASLARQHGLTRTCVIGALYGPYPRMERIIAEAIGVEPSTLWPERYANDVQTTRRRSKRQ